MIDFKVNRFYKLKLKSNKEIIVWNQLLGRMDFTMVQQHAKSRHKEAQIKGWIESTT